MTFSEVVDDALSMVERRGETTLPTDRMVRRRLQRLCDRNRWYWRKQTLTFSTVAGTATYDLSSITTSPTSKGKDLVEIIDLFDVRSATDVRWLRFLADEDQYAAAVADTVTGDPTSYFLDRGSSQTIRLYRIPDAVRTIRMDFWATPYFASDDSTEAIPYLPSQLHHILVTGMAYDLAVIGYGIQDPRTVALKAQYEEDLMEAYAKDSGSTRKYVDLRDHSNAVRSTS